MPEVAGPTTDQATLRYIDVKAGEGTAAEWGKEFTVHYTGWLRDGTQFDSSARQAAVQSSSRAGGR